MNNAKMWLVVSPSVGVPIFLGAVAIGSFAVHVAVLSKVSWYNDFLAGNELGSGDSASATMLQGSDLNTANAAYISPLLEGGQEITVILPDGTTARAVLKSNDVLASADLPSSALIAK
jgi:light-harvesting protein B-800-850 alpha chain